MILDRFRLDGKACIVTGAGKGIGRAIAIGFAEAGGNVVCAARTQEDIDATAAEVEKAGGRAIALKTDVLDEDSRSALVETAVKEFGRLDVLVNNAGGTAPRPALKTSLNYLQNALQFNVVQAFHLMQLAAPRMVETAGGGSIVNVSSRSGDMPQTSQAAYGASKAALNMATHNLALDFAPKVRVNAIGCGGVETEGLKVALTNPDLRKMFEDNTPMHRAGDPEDIACMALYLASDASNWVTGKIFQVDGGTSAPSMSVPAPPL